MSMRDRPPRRIDDVAHLYLSRMQRSPETTGHRVVHVAGSSADVLPGFHVANLALSLSRQNHRVMITDRSGLVTNAGFFLSLPPEIYLGRGDDDRRSPVRAFSNVWFRRDRDVLADASRYSHFSIELVHATPGTRTVMADRSPAGSARTQPRATNDTWILFDEGETHTDGDAMVHRVNTAPRREAVVMAAPGLTVSHWRQSANDLVPTVLRDSRSHLSSCYETIARVLLRTARAEKKGRHSHAG